MEIRWRTSVSASCFHAAECLRRGEPLVDAALAEALREPATTLTFELEEAGAPVGRLLDQLAPLSAQLESNRELAAAALVKTLGAARAAEFQEPLAGRIADLESAFARTAPQAADELPLRVEPIRMQFEAHGPGLLHMLARLTEPELLAERAEVVLVQPICGGGGRAFRAYNLVLFEALLTDARPELPETLRLAWLLMQLQLDLPRYHDRLSHAQLDAVAPAALTPAVLSAAQEIGLARCDEETVDAALAAWRVAGPVSAGELLTWWDECQASRPPWPVALVALEQMRRAGDG